MAKELKKAVAYIRTSSAANVGVDKDSAPRQQRAIAGFAKRAGIDHTGVAAAGASRPQP